MNLKEKSILLHKLMYNGCFLTMILKANVGMIVLGFNIQKLLLNF